MKGSVMKRLVECEHQCARANDKWLASMHQLIRPCSPTLDNSSLLDMMCYVTQGIQIAMKCC